MAENRYELNKQLAQMLKGGVIITALRLKSHLALIDGYDHILVVGEDFLLAIELRDYYGTTKI